MLTTYEAALHFGLTSATVRRYARAGKIIGHTVLRDYRFSWEVIWGCEQGPMPRGRRCALYKTPLLNKAELGALTGHSVRTIERWIDAGLPTRNVFANVRINKHDASCWLKTEYGFDLSAASQRDLP